MFWKKCDNLENNTRCPAPFPPETPNNYEKHTQNTITHIRNLQFIKEFNIPASINWEY